MATAKKTIKKDTVGLSSPWQIFADTLISLFKNDDEITITVPKKEKEGIFTITIESANTAKLASLKKLIGEKREYGNITVVVEYVDSSEDRITVDDIATAFANNPYYIKTVVGETPYGTFAFPVVAKEVIQFYVDDMTDGYGNANLTVAETIRSIIDPDKCIKNIVITTANGTE